MHLGEMVEKIKYAANNCKQNNFTQEVFIMKKIKFVIAIIGCFVVLNSLTISASAANIYVQTWRLIDAGGHLDWSDEGTKYLSQWKSAVNISKMRPYNVLEAFSNLKKEARLKQISRR